MQLHLRAKLFIINYMLKFIDVLIVLGLFVIAILLLIKGFPITIGGIK
jgi:hypothetical protein